MSSERAARAFFSFIRIEDSAVHEQYNRWHQLDHLPENRALPGVLWGDRWRLTEASKASAEGRMRNIDYVAMYWFRAPVDQSVHGWSELGKQSFQWGRGPVIPGVQRDLLAFFLPQKGVVAERTAVTAHVLPLRPHTGVHLRVVEFSDDTLLDDALQREHETVVPELLTTPGVIGAWTFSFIPSARQTSMPVTQHEHRGQKPKLARLLFLEHEGHDAVVRIRDVDALHTDYPAEDLLLSAHLTTISPWKDWK